MSFCYTEGDDWSMCVGVGVCVCVVGPEFDFHRFCEEQNQSSEAPKVTLPKWNSGLIFGDRNVLIQFV